MDNDIWSRASKIFGYASGFIALVVGVSFVYGYIKYSSFLSAVGVEWYSSSVPTTNYALYALMPFALITSSAVIIYVLLHATHKKIEVKFWYYFLSGLVFVYLIYSGWLLHSGLEGGEEESLKWAARISNLMLPVVGGAISTYLFCMRVSFKDTKALAIKIVICSFLILVSIPRVSGYANGLIVRGTCASDLPFIEISGMRWAILDYKKDNSLLIRYSDSARPDTMFFSVEKIAINNDSKTSFPKFVRFDKDK